MFKPLLRSQIRGIARIQLQLLQQRLDEREMMLDITDPVLDKLIELGFDPVYGARPLKRALQQMIENPLAEELLAGKYLPGQTIRASLAGESVVFEAV